MTSSLTKNNNKYPTRANDSFRFGIEEEYFLGWDESLRPPRTSPDDMFRRFGHHETKRELLQCQIEVATRPHSSNADARDELKALRQGTAEISRAHGLRILACGTHPLAIWREALPSPKPRYEKMVHDLQMLARRNMLCGMHVHVEVPNPARRVEVMRRMMPYLPLLLALSTSSPFWERFPSGLKGYRLTAYDELPRTGIPELFTSEQDYVEYIDAMRRSNAIDDASHVWWSIRPSPTYPTLELRITDCCTRLEDACAIAALYRSLVRHLYRNPRVNADMTVVDRSIALENKWLAQRHGCAASFVTRDGAISVAEMLRQLVEQIGDDAEALSCFDELGHCKSIVIEGSAADAQLRIFNRYDHNETEEGLRAVVQWVADATLAA
jgi:carboxylate-amine ligase